MDLVTMTLATALVVFVGGALYIGETLLRRDTGVGRLWSAAYLAGIGSTCSFALWSLEIASDWTNALGNTLFAAAPGLMWLGCRHFNERPLRVATIVVVALSTWTLVASLVEAPALGSWAGWTAMALAITVQFVAATIETLRRPMRRVTSAQALALVFAVAALFYAARLVAYLVLGPDDAVFETFFGTIAAHIGTITLTIVAVAAMSVLRTLKAPVRRFEWLSENGVAADGVMLQRTFTDAVRDIVERAGWRRELVMVAVVRIEELARISTAFGPEAAGELVEVWRHAVRRHAPASSFVGQLGDEQLVVCALAATAADARRRGGLVFRGCIDEIRASGAASLPGLGVGVALTETVGYDADLLIASAQEAAERAVDSADASVLFGGLGALRARVRAET